MISLLQLRSAAALLIGVWLSRCLFMWSISSLEGCALASMSQSFGKNTGQVPAVVAAGELTSTELYLYPPALPQALMRLELAGACELSPSR